MNRLRALLTNNLGLKALSVLLALLLWHQVSSRQVVQWTLTIPVAFTNVPLDLEIVNDPIREVRVDIRSDRGSLALEQRRLTAVVDLKDVQAGPQLIQLSEQNINRAPGLEIRNITPSRLQLVLEHTRTRQVPVDAVVEGQPAGGFELMAIQVEPAVVVVSGPESLVEKVDKVYTRVVDISDSRQSVTSDTFIDLDEPLLRINDSVKVTVTAVIEEKRKPATITSVPVRVSPADAEFQLIDKSVTLRGSVPLSFEGKLPPALFEVAVDISELEPRREAHLVEPKVSIPEEFLDIFKLQAVQPEKVRVRRIRGNQ